MKVVDTYLTKAKWALDLLVSTGVPMTGYYSDGRCRPSWAYQDLPSKLGNPGENYIVHGTLVLARTERGRSAASFIFAIPSSLPGDLPISTTLSGMEGIIDAASRGLVKLGRGEYYVDQHTRNAVGTYDKSSAVTDGPAFTGYWTFAKQGSEVSIVAAPRDLLVSLRFL